MMTSSADVQTLEPHLLEMYDGKKVVVRQAPWDDVTFASDLPHITRELFSLRGRLEMHSRNLGTGEFVKRPLTDDEVDCLHLDESGTAILDKT